MVSEQFKKDILERNRKRSRSRLQTKFGNFTVNPTTRKGKVAFQVKRGNISFGFFPKLFQASIEAQKLNREELRLKRIAKAAKKGLFRTGAAAKEGALVTAEFAALSRKEKEKILNKRRSSRVALALGKSAFKFLFEESKPRRKTKKTKKKKKTTKRR